MSVQESLPKKSQVKKPRVKDLHFKDNRRKVQKTFRPKGSEIEKKWWLIDASSKTLGRLATQISILLRGKHKSYYLPDVDTGDFVVVVNCDKVRLSGNKLEQKVYYRHSKFVGSLKKTTAKEMLQKKPEKILFSAVKGMLPKNKLGSAQLKKLKLYVGPEHKNSAQKPSVYEIKGLSGGKQKIDEEIKTQDAKSKAQVKT